MTAPVLVGTTSWSERTLVHETRWYPRRTMKAAERIAFYASQFPLVEIDATARFPPTPDLCRQWVERTPPGFTVDVQAWTLLAGGGALPDSLWEDLRDEVRPELRDRRRLYLGHLSAAARREAWGRFAHALEPLREAGRLGAVVLRYPRWLRPGQTGRALIAEARARLGGLALVAELRHPRWLDGGECEQTLAFLEDHDVGFVCVDRAVAPVVASTTDLTLVRFPGRNPGNWEDPDLEIGERYAYRYATEELEAWVRPVLELAAGGEVHAVFSNCWRDDAVSNAAGLVALLAGVGGDDGADH
ncbi:MAG TPA: DUF72 domain-containing protein [Acidimicrobiales bacterium]|nr:DUF72 domain-containing protein [Acidimicrobiales bacterium]